MQYNIAIACIADTFFSIAIGIAILFYHNIAIGIADTLFSIACHAIAILLAILFSEINFLSRLIMHGCHIFAINVDRPWTCVTTH